MSLGKIARQSNPNSLQIMHLPCSFHHDAKISGQLRANIGKLS
ncbi:Uncharacterized protein ChrSV_4775 [Chromobacterium vaccinii]|nr:Uncharacterized protein ChrSW_4775 [Chromobacterium vaccinii]QND92230.1 Uncharacterized protein ChrSV_4775 [Chromobacterium vaccinii]